MAATAVPMSTQAAALGQDKPSYWLRNKRWDLIFMILSVFVVPLPYIFYLIGMDVFGLHPDVSRNVVNGFVAIAVGGPHMMSTLLRTGLDGDFKRRYPMLIRSSLIIPIIVVALAFLNLTLLLTTFFFWAMLHVLHQVTYIVELYNHKEHTIVKNGRSAVSFTSRAIDYGVVLTCLFPMAAFKIAQGSFAVGTNDLTQSIPTFFQQPWLFYLAAIIFFVSGILWIGKTFREIQAGIVNWPKTVFIGLTVLVFFPLASFPNLDTAFQGANMWHSFQYLAITFYIIKIRQQYGDLKESAPLVSRFSNRKDSWGLFALSTMMLVGSLIVFVVVYVVAQLIFPAIDANRHFDTAYYTAILSFLWIHYYHDHFLFTNFEALDAAFKSDAA